MVCTKGQTLLPNSKRPEGLNKNFRSYRPSYNRGGCRTWNIARAVKRLSLKAHVIGTGSRLGYLWRWKLSAAQSIPILPVNFGRLSFFLKGLGCLAHIDLSFRERERGALDDEMIPRQRYSPVSGIYVTTAVRYTAPPPPVIARPNSVNTIGSNTVGFDTIHDRFLCLFKPDGRNGRIHSNERWGLVTKCATEAVAHTQLAYSNIMDVYKRRTPEGSREDLSVRILSSYPPHALHKSNSARPPRGACGLRRWRVVPVVGYLSPFDRMWYLLRRGRIAPSCVSRGAGLLRFGRGWEYNLWSRKKSRGRGGVICAEMRWA
ncbi:hypothetical protein B0H13DRAFT_1890368 [Mycena leptocephala]|nr:hypothetical protein B0H13DRAFT_1890368 [Mycena leptocephala]